MTRTAQTIWIVGAIIGAVLLYMAYDSITNPNLDDLHPYDRCQYWAYWHKHGGSVRACQDHEMKEIEYRIGSAADPDSAAPAENLIVTIPDNELFATNSAR